MAGALIDQRRACRSTSRTTRDSSQLTIDNRIAAQIAVHQKWSIASPQCVVCSVIRAHQRVDDDVEETKGQDVQRNRQELNDWLDERVDQSEDHGHREDDADSLQRSLAADEAQPVHELGDDPEGKTGQCGA